MDNKKTAFEYDLKNYLEKENPINDFKEHKENTEYNDQELEKILEKYIAIGAKNK